MAKKKNSPEQPLANLPTPTQFSRIYFDTSVLRGNGWPKISSGLATLFKLANDVEVQCAIPTPVLIELEEWWLGELGKQSVELGRHVAGILEPLSMPTGKELVETYRASVRELLDGNQVTITPPTARSLEEIFREVAAHKSPFESPSHFRDGVIQLSIFDDLVAQKSSAGGAVVVFDKGFATRVQTSTSARELSVCVYTELNPIKSALEQLLSKLELKKVEDDRESLKEALKEPACKIQIERYLSRNLRLRSNPDLRAIRKIQRIYLQRVETPFPPERVEGETIKAYADFEVILLVVVAKVLVSHPEQPDHIELKQEEPPSLGVGETNPNPPSEGGFLSGTLISDNYGSTAFDTLVTNWKPQLWNVGPKSEVDEEWKFRIRVHLTARYSNGLYDNVSPVSFEEVSDSTTQVTNFQISGSP